MSVIAEDFTKALLEVDKEKAKRILLETSNVMTPEQTIETVVVSSLESIGKGWERGDYALSQVYMSGRICEELVQILLPTGNNQVKSKPKIAIAMLNDYHSLGKQVVFSTVRAGGIDLMDYGRVDIDTLIQKIKNDNIEIILISVLMFSSALQVKALKEMLCRKGLTTKIVVGGAPFRLNHQLWQDVGADAVGYTSSDILEILHKMLGRGAE